MRQQFRLPQVRYESVVLEGGYDLVTPTLSLKPGVCRDALNFEINVTGGYTRVKGYERFDGRLAPSSAQYLILVLNTTAGLAVNNVVNNSPGTATATVLAVTPTLAVVSKVVNTFAAGEVLRVGGTPIGTISQVGYGVSSLQDAQYSSLAANLYRADITVVPGSGPVRGVCYYNGTVYAWRDNAGGTAMAIHKSSGAGWTAVPLGFELRFTVGSGTQPAEGSSVTKGAVSAVVRRVVIESGTFGAGTAAGRLIIDAPTGGNFSAGAFTAGITANCSGIQTAITLLPGSRVRTRIGSFGGANNTRIYGCDGINRGFEFDGTVYVPIVTGNAVDTPTRLAIHASRLFLAFGSSVQFSVIVKPYQWLAVNGAGEFAMDDNVTDMISLPGSGGGSAMLIASLKSTSILYGTTSSTFERVPYSVGIGAVSDTAQRMEQTYAFSERGIIKLDQSQNYGNFDTATLTFNIRPFVESRRTLAVAGGLNRDKSQYRVFFSDGFALYATIVNGQYMGSMPIYMPDVMSCWCEGETPSGSETSFFGSTNGFVYRLDSGTSHDGVAMDYRILLNYNTMGSPRLRKRFMRASLEMTGSTYASIGFSYELGYTSSQITQPGTVDYSAPFSAVNWDSFTWDNFIWDGKTLGPTEVAMNGTAENIALRFSGRSAIYDSFTINSAILHYIPRRELRG